LPSCSSAWPTACRIDSCARFNTSRC
jgi:hypothetical protein